ncbi:tetratricopeptide repeat protein [Sphingosinicella rhizophila]|uniref:Tetratricopeptide repeat protein n=1 Tax=Sphingosinicella rhizophila TaxID=3050082 RepID=A0ABU3Q799_9SPHN|nr:tetratricopeptide repeat protein [Sphingosinicella sp. GR2756]MDT9599177.1 tetratricopeptide repeat protein [Sphingosinicella sp. GR2756]
MRRSLCLVLPALLAAAACSNVQGDESAEAAYRKGLLALEQGQPRTARIEFLNAIKAQPGNGRIRIAQALTYLQLGDGIAAEAELVRARQLGVSVSDTGHLMAHALILQDQPDRAVAEAKQAGPAYAAYAARMRGRAAMLLGDEQDALAAFEDALAAAPSDSAAWTDLARFRRSTGDLAAAIAAADKAAKLDPRSVEALTLRGELTRRQYGLGAALPWFDRAIEIDPDNVGVLLERAITYGDLGRMGAMLADARKVLAIAPGNPVAYYLQAMLAARGRNFELADAIFRRTKGALDDQPAAMLLAGAIAFETGSTAEAVKWLDRLVALQPDNGKARRLLAAAHMRAGDADAVLAVLRPLADRPDADAYTLTLMGQALASKGDREGASLYYARAAQPASRNASALLADPLDPQTLDAWRADADAAPDDAGLQIRLIRGLLATGLGGEALQRSRRLQAAHPGTPETHMLVGDAFGIQGDFAAAAGAYRRAANLSFTEPVALRLIEALRNAGDQAGAALVLRLFLQQNPQNVPAQMLAANSLMQAEGWDGAIRIYENLRLRIGNRDATLLNNLAWAYSETGDHDRALPLARRAWQLDRNNPATADTYGWLLFKSGKNKAQGLALLEQAARGAPSDADIRRRLAAVRGG